MRHLIRHNEKVAWIAGTTCVERRILVSIP
jgi:hypothetical protein